jgi:hypothetical protein
MLKGEEASAVMTFMNTYLAFWRKQEKARLKFAETIRVSRTNRNRMFLVTLNSSALLSTFLSTYTSAASRSPDKR